MKRVLQCILYLALICKVGSYQLEFQWNLWSFARFQHSSFCKQTTIRLDKKFNILSCCLFIWKMFFHTIIPNSKEKNYNRLNFIKAKAKTPESWYLHLTSFREVEGGRGNWKKFYFTVNRRVMKAADWQLSDRLTGLPLHQLRWQEYWAKICNIS